MISFTGRSRVGVVAVFVTVAIIGTFVGVLTSSSTPSRRTATATSSAPGLGSTSTSTTVVLPTYRASENARQDVAETGCAVTNGALTMTGVVDNPSTVARTYTIVVNFVVAATASVVALRVLTIADLAPHRSTAWSSSGPTDALGLSCVVQFVLAVPSA